MQPLPGRGGPTPLTHSGGSSLKQSLWKPRRLPGGLTLRGSVRLQILAEPAPEGGLQGRGMLHPTPPPAQLPGEMSFPGSAARAAAGGASPTGPTAGWQAAPGAAVLREQIWGSAESPRSWSGCLPEAAQAAPGDAGGPDLTWHLSRPRVGERGLEVRGHGHRPPLLVDLRLCLRLRHRRHVPPAALPELRHQLSAAARPGHPHLQIAPGRPPVLPAGPRDSEGPRAPHPLPRCRAGGRPVPESRVLVSRQPLQTNKYSHRRGAASF